jgi:CheY-like chemotaxis protein
MTPTLAAADAGTSRSAVVADDSEAVRKLIGAVLRRGGFDVREAADGAAARRLVEERTPDLLVVDDVLPGLSGSVSSQARAGSAPRGRGDGVRTAFLTIVVLLEMERSLGG